MKRHFELVSLPFSLTVNSSLGILLVPAAFAAQQCYRKNAVFGVLMVILTILLACSLNRGVYLFMKKHAEADLTVSERSAQFGAIISAAAASLPSAALLIFGIHQYQTVIAICVNVAVFVFALTIYYSQRRETTQRNR